MSQAWRTCSNGFWDLDTHAFWEQELNYLWWAIIVTLVHWGCFFLFVLRRCSKVNVSALAGHFKWVFLRWKKSWGHVEKNIVSSHSLVLDFYLLLPLAMRGQTGTNHHHHQQCSASQQNQQGLMVISNNVALSAHTHTWTDTRTQMHTHKLRGHTATSTALLD